MTDFSNRQQQERMQSYLNIHLKKDAQSLSKDEQIAQLHKKERNKWIMLAVNIAALLVFGYSFYYDITDLGQTFFYVIVAVFGINVGLIFYQKKQIRELVDYLNWKKQHDL